MERTAQQLYRENLIQRFNDPDLQDFVQSTINILSDGIDVDDLNGLKLEAKGGSKKLVSFYEKIKNKSSIWDIGLGETSAKVPSLNISAEGKPVLTLTKSGFVGISNESPDFHLDVDGLTASTGRVGNFAIGKIPADGAWHTLLNNLTGTVGFEALAHIINEPDERYGLTYGILLMSEKKSNKNVIRSIDAASNWLWGRWLNKIKFRWTIDSANSTEVERKYSLEMKSRTRQGLPGGNTPYIYYRLAKIWDKQFETGISLSDGSVFLTTFGKTRKSTDTKEQPEADNQKEQKRSISIKSR